MTLREELQDYLDRVYAPAKIKMPHSVGGKVHIRFELGGELRNGTKKRVKQAAERALAIFNDTFETPGVEVWVLIYEYGLGRKNKASNAYLHGLFPADVFAAFYSQRELVNTRYFSTSTAGKEVLEQQEVRVIVGKVPINGLNALELLRGIANAEMGLEPSVDQTVMFFDPQTDRGFYMYDDRGCYVWSDDADKLRNIYVGRNEWIVEYHRAEIDRQFS